MVDQGILLKLKKSYSDQGVFLSDTELENKVNSLSKLQIMDEYFCDINVTAEKVFEFVREIFTIDLRKATVLNSDLLDSLQNPSPQDALDYLIGVQQNPFTGEDIRSMVNNVFGVNLNGIVSLEGKKISLYSKDQWIIKGENDLFIVSTGKSDLDVRVEPSEYFKERTGSKEVPLDLKETLEEVGFTCLENSYCYYATPDRKPVPDAFKGRTLGLLMKIIEEIYAEL